ncbi:MAG: glycosyl transferase [Planctomycetaceae bacterium]|nr:glycosyl transferase [Planctomycetaceae bacterium]
MNEWKTLVSVATYNERENIQRLVAAIREIVDGIHVLVIDDASPDGTGDWCEQFERVHDWFHYVQRGSKQGLGTATICGMQYAIEHEFDLWIGMDADFSHPPERLPALIEAIGTPTEPVADVVIGSRYCPEGGVSGWPLKRRIMSRCVNLYARILMGLSPKDCSGAYRCCRIAMLEELDFSAIRSTGYSFFEEFLWRLKRLGARIVEVPIIFADREYGQSKLNRKEAVHSLWMMFKLGIRNWLRLE